MILDEAREYRGGRCSVVCLLNVVAAGNQAGPAQPQMRSRSQERPGAQGFPSTRSWTRGHVRRGDHQDCTGCHSIDILSGSRDAFAVVTPMIQKARQMVVMMNALNRTYFGGQKRVTCYTCHTATPVPGRVPNLSIQYGTPPAENPNALEFIALPELASQVDQIFARYIQALGGAQRLAGVTSFVASGTYAGWNIALEVPWTSSRERLIS